MCRKSGGLLECMHKTFDRFYNHDTHWHLQNMWQLMGCREKEHITLSTDVSGNVLMEMYVDCEYVDTHSI